jgi:predicted AlkP superfamily phosphohydrolase/phosphomutase
MAKRLPRLVIVGVDGASHELISRWSANGDLPTLAGAFECQPVKPLLTAFPPHTAPGWT